VLSAEFQLTRQILIVKEYALLIQYQFYELKIQQFTRTGTKNIARLYTTRSN
jgi:hypothetical protein